MITIILIDMLIELLEFFIDILFKFPGVQTLVNMIVRAFDNIEVPSVVANIIKEALISVVGIETAMIVRKWFRKWFI